MATGSPAALAPIAMAAEQGRSLVETLAGIALALGLSGAAAVSIPPTVRGVRLRGAAVQLAAAMVRARAAAIAEGRAWDLRCQGDLAFDLGPIGGDAVRESLPAGIRFASATSGGAVRFSPSGAAENATFLLEDAAATRRKVVVNQRGRITVE